jgi:serine/threonine protein kinase
MPFFQNRFKRRKLPKTEKNIFDETFNIVFKENRNKHPKLKALFTNNILRIKSETCSSNKSVKDAKLYPLFCSGEKISINNHREIARGSFGVVYEIGNYIYKTIIYKSDDIYYNELKGLFLNYLLTLYLLNDLERSKYICKLYEFGHINRSDSKDLYCLMENGGEELYEYLKEYCSSEYFKHLSINKKIMFFLEILLQCSNSLKILHDIGYVHLDIKPENFLIKINEDGTFQIKIIDFGFSNPVDYDLRNLQGTPFYINLLYYRDLSNLSKSKALFTYDIFGLGCMFIEFITNYIYDKKFNVVLPFIKNLNESNNFKTNRLKYNNKSLQKNLDTYLFKDLNTNDHETTSYIKVLIVKMVSPGVRFNNIDEVIAQIIILQQLTYYKSLNIGLRPTSF